VRAELAGTRGRCPSCGALLQVPTLEEAARARPTARRAAAGGGDARSTPKEAVGATCSICQTTVGAGEPALGCRVCDLPYHAECWEEYGGCAAYGCENAPKVEKKPEEARKECPFCGESIPAKALRCPSCRERFEDARPVDREEYINDIIQEPKRKQTRAKALALLTLALIPCAGPVTLIIGAMWFQSGKRDFDEAGELYRVMVGASAGMGGLHTLLLLAFFVGLITA
jgi:hypothetical protein